jgi:hypothetical protein
MPPTPDLEPSMIEVAMFRGRHLHPDCVHTHRISKERLNFLWTQHLTLPMGSYPRSNYHCEGLTESPDNPKLYLATSVDKFEPDDFLSPDTFVQDLISDAAQSARHFCRLDTRYAQLVDCVFVHSTASDPGITATPVERARDLLLRLPDTPVELSPDFEVASGLVPPAPGDGYCQQSSLLPQWNNMVAASAFSTNVSLFALLLSQDSEKSIPSIRNLRRLSDTTAGLLKIAASIQRVEVDPIRARACYVVRAFLWSSWQRFTMLFLWCVQFPDVDSAWWLHA